MHIHRFHTVDDEDDKLVRVRLKSCCLLGMSMELHLAWIISPNGCQMSDVRTHVWEFALERDEKQIESYDVRITNLFSRHWRERDDCELR